MRNYNVKKFGEPTWQKLVEAVGDPAGGANAALARKIATNHKAESGAATRKVTRKRKSKSEANPTVAKKRARRSKSEGEASLTAVGKAAKRSKSEGESKTAAARKVTKTGGMPSGYAFV